MAGLMRVSALTSERSGTEPDSSRRLIISLTTFSKRIDDVYLTVESLLQQSVKPNHIVLWLSREEFSERDVPALLRMQEQRGLQVRFCERDLGPYKKIIPALREFPDHYLITVDDDVIYPPDLVDKLWRAHLDEPNIIHACRVHRISLDGKGALLPYKQWERSFQQSVAGLEIYPVGVEGVLYFPGCFSSEVRDEATFMRLAPMADDVWLKAMSLKAGTLCKRVPEERSGDARYIVVDGSQKFALKRGNKSKIDGNDVKINNVFTHFNLLPKLLRA